MEFCFDKCFFVVSNAKHILIISYCFQGALHACTECVCVSLSTSDRLSLGKSMLHESFQFITHRRERIIYMNYTKCQSRYFVLVTNFSKLTASFFSLTRLTLNNKLSKYTHSTYNTRTMNIFCRHRW